MPVKRLKAWNDRRKALKVIRGHHPNLAETLKGAEFQTKTIESVGSSLDFTRKQWYHHSSSLALIIDAGLKSKAITPNGLEKAVKVMGKSLVATKKAGYYPGELGDVLKEGLKTGAIKQERLKETTEAIRKSLEAEEDAGLRVMTELKDIFRRGFKEKKITSKELVVMAPVLVAIAKDGGNPVEFAKILVKDLESKAIDEKTIHQHLLLRKELPKQWSYKQVLKHALKVKGVPKSRIATYQRMLIREGHFPNARLVEELHKDYLKEMNKKK